MARARTRDLVGSLIEIHAALSREPGKYTETH
jgi:hypothetical protein